MYVQDVVATAAAMHAFGGLYKSCMLGEKTKSLGFGFGFGLHTTKFGDFCFLFFIIIYCKD
ncbi:hypothetical protein PHAVU_002G078901 [Phaseolus vulgaris]